LIETFSNFASNTLAGAIDDSQTSIDVANASVFPSPQFRISIDSEIMLVTGVASNTLTVTRGAENTTPAAHDDLATVRQCFTVGAREKWREDNVMVDTFANRPAAGRAGAMFIASDGIAIWRDNGVSWDAYGPINRFTPPPAVANWTFINQGGATAVDLAGSILITDPAHSGNDARLLVRAAPSTPYVITACILPSFDQGDDLDAIPSFGILFRNSGGDVFHNISYGWVNSGTFQATTPWQRAVSEWTSPSTFNTTLITTRRITHSPHVAWLRIADNGTNRTFAISADGVHFETLFTEASNAVFTADQVGLIINNQVDGGTPRFNSSIRLLSWEE
jgi:hypothetical protein